MKKYFGTKVIQAKSATYGEYRSEKYSDKQFDSKMSLDNTPGYMVQYSDNYISWSPKKTFEDAYKLIHGEFNELKLGTVDNTYVMHDENTFNAPHNYLIYQSNGEPKVLCGIHFQEGPIKEHGVNGIFHEDLINICIDRLKHFQDSEFACEYNERAIGCLEAAIKELKSRTKDRIKRKVQGTYKV